MADSADLVTLDRGNDTTVTVHLYGKHENLVFLFAIFMNFGIILSRLPKNSTLKVHVLL